jgi:hypothetical protein
MQLRKRTYPFIAAVVILAIAVPATAACERLWVVDRELWSVEGEQARLLLTDVRGVLHPHWSPAGDRVAYVHDFRFENGPQSEIVVTAATGESVASLVIPADSGVNAIVQVGWRSDRRVYAEGHVNPSTTKYFEWDLPSGRLVDEKPGSWFAVSPDGRFVAQRAHVPHGAPPPYDSATLLINDKVAYPPEGDTGYHKFTGGAAWSPDSTRVALLDEQNDAVSLVIIAPGKGTTRTPVAASAGPAEVSWSGSNGVTIRSGDDEWHVDAAGGKVEKTGSLKIAGQSTTPPPAALRDRSRGIAPRAEDSRCKE